MSSQLVQILIGAGGLVMAGGVGYGVHHIGRLFKVSVREIVVESLVQFKAELDKRFDHNDNETEAAKTLAADLKLELARQFGGNGGGLRQAINEQRGELSSLKGAFDQHIKEVGKGNG